MKKIKVLAMALFIAIGATLATTSTSQAAEKKVTIFYSPTCPHCHHLLDFADSTLKKKYPTVKFDLKNTTDRSVIAEWNKFKRGANLNTNNYGVPQTYIANELVLGFGRPETTGKQIINKIDNKFFR